MKSFLDLPEFADIREHQTDWKWIQSELTKTATQLESIRRRRAALLLCAFELGKIGDGDTLNGVPVADYLAYARQEISYKALDRLRTATDCKAIAKTGLPPKVQDLYLDKPHHHFKVTSDGRVVETRATLDKIPRADYERTYNALGLLPKAQRKELAEVEAKAIRKFNREFSAAEPVAKTKQSKPWSYDHKSGVFQFNNFTGSISKAAILKELGIREPKQVA